MRVNENLEDEVDKLLKNLKLPTIEQVLKYLKVLDDKKDACARAGHPGVTSGSCDPRRGLKYYDCSTCGYYSKRMTQKDYDRVNELFSRPMKI